MKGEKTGEDMVSIGFVVDLDYADATTRSTTCSSSSSSTRSSGASSTAASAWLGRQGAAGGGYWSMPKLSMPGAVLVGDAGAW
jgi:electron-transferring-flavoprotein dehydrogenase